MEVSLLPILHLRDHVPRQSHDAVRPPRRAIISRNSVMGLRSTATGWLARLALQHPPLLGLEEPFAVLVGPRTTGRHVAGIVPEADRVPELIFQVLQRAVAEQPLDLLLRQ